MQVDVVFLCTAYYDAHGSTDQIDVRALDEDFAAQERVAGRTPLVWQTQQRHALREPVIKFLDNILVSHPPHGNTLQLRLRTLCVASCSTLVCTAAARRRSITSMMSTVTMSLSIMPCRVAGIARDAGRGPQCVRQTELGCGHLELSKQGGSLLRITKLIVSNAFDESKTTVNAPPPVGLR